MKTCREKIGLRRIAIVFLLLLAATAAQAGTVSGVVRNGTQGDKTAAGVSVLLIKLEGEGMNTVATTKTDAQGRYHFDNPDIGAGPMMISAVYRNINFRQPLTPGTPTVDLTVFEPTTNPKALQVTMRLVVFQPNGDKLLVGEEYSLENNSKPPVAYYKQDGDFEFSIPDGAEIQQVTTFGPSGVPLLQGTINKGKGRYAIAYAFRPGQNGVRFSYTIPYNGNQASILENSPYDAQRVLLAVPPTMQIQSAGFDAAGAEQGFNVFSKDSVKGGTSFTVALSGTAPPPAAAAAAPSQGGDNAAAGSASAGTPDITIETVPARLDDQKWILLGGLAAIFAVSAGLLLRRPSSKEAQLAAPAPASPVPPPPPANVAEQVDREVNMDLASLKDTLLRIELRRQAGTISEEEYARERGRAEQLLRDLVRG